MCDGFSEEGPVQLKCGTGGDVLKHNRQMTVRMYKIPTALLFYAKTLHCGVASMNTSWTAWTPKNIGYDTFD